MTKKDEKKWSIAKSIFSKYKIDTDSINNRCFDYDWEYCWIPNIIKDEHMLLKVKNLIHSKYKEM